jgi:transposase
MEIVEVVRRGQVGESQRAIAHASGVARETVKKYLRAAEEFGLAANGPPPTEDQVVRLVQVARVVSAPRTWASPQVDRLEPYREQITTWLQDEQLQLTRVQELLGQRGVQVPYTTLARFVWRLGYRPRHGRRGDTVRMAPTPPGEVAEMDFERLGLLRNGYSEIELKRFSGHLSLRSLEVYIAHNREAAKRKARAWERHGSTLL